MHRRGFLGATLAATGGIFVPRFGRWYREGFGTIHENGVHVYVNGLYVGQMEYVVEANYITFSKSLEPAVSLREGDVLRLVQGNRIQLEYPPLGRMHPKYPHPITFETGGPLW